MGNIIISWSEYEDILNVNRSGSDSAELLSRGGGGFEEISRKIVN